MTNPQHQHEPAPTGWQRFRKAARDSFPLIVTAWAIIALTYAFWRAVIVDDPTPGDRFLWAGACVLALMEAVSTYGREKNRARVRHIGGTTITIQADAATHARIAARLEELLARVDSEARRIITEETERTKADAN